MLIRSNAKKFMRILRRSIIPISYHARHRRRAMAAVDVIQKYNGRHLTHKMKNKIDAYAIDVLGHVKYAPWLYVYTLIRGEFKEGWIPDNFWGRLVVPAVNKKLAVVSDFKTFSNVVLRTEALPDIGYHIDGILYDKNFSIISVDKFRLEITRNHDFVYLKQDGTQQGKGILKAKVEELLRDRLVKFVNCVIQSPIKQHPFFENMVSGSVATLRITTVKEKNGDIGMRAAYLRVGRQDRPWVESSSAIKVAVIDGDGRLDSSCYTPDWRRWERHPDTGFSFANQLIPHFDRAVQLCVSLHKKIPHVTVVGWDTAIDEGYKVKVIEWNNNHSDIKFSEATTGPCFLGLDWEAYARK